MAPIVLCVACGSHYPAAPPAPDAGPTVAVVQHLSSGTMTGSAADIAISPTHAGDLLMVSVAYNGPPVVPTVTSNAGTMSPLDWVRAYDCPSTTATWHMWRGANDGGDRIHVSFPSAYTFDVFVLELSGATFDREEAVEMQQPPTGTVATSPAVDASAGEVVYATVATCGKIDALAPGGPFTSFQTDALGDMAFYLPDHDGTFAAAWETETTAWQTRTIAF